MLIKAFLIWVFSLLALTSYSSELNIPVIKFAGEEIDQPENAFLSFSSESKLDVDVALSSTLRSGQVSQGLINFGTTNQHHYLLFNIKNVSEQSHVCLDLGLPAIDVVDLYRIDGYSIEPRITTGQRLPFSSRSNNYRDFTFNLDVHPGETGTFLIHLNSGEQLVLPLKFLSKEQLDSRSITQDIFFGMYVGIMLVMFFYNLFLLISTLERSYFYYILYIVSIGFAQITLQGYGFRFLWPNLPTLAVLDTYIFGGLSGITVLLFARDYLKTHEFSRTFDRLILALVLLDVVAIGLSFFGFLNLSYNIINTVAGVGSFMLLGLAFYLGFLRNLRAAKFFFVAWSVFLVSVIIYILKDQGILPYNDYTDNILLSGSAVEAVLLSLALADRINILKSETAMAQKRELNAVKQNEKLVTEQNILLEKKVKERTDELSKANDRLEKTLIELKNAQVHLVNAEKMASLGQLTAGIAHEINNPINFVGASVIPLRKDLEDLHQMIAFYDEKVNQYLDQEKKDIINQKKHSLDIDFVLQEIDELLNGVEEGASRTAEIVQGLKNFSRLDEAEANQANIHDLLNSTLVVLRNMLKDKVEIVKEFDSSMEEIACFPGKLNQVFSNIITNAVQALASTENPRILISTQNLSDKVVITIKDNGPGIPEEIRSKIFEPFFTTKDVGAGTGLGLSIVYSIINQHNGEIDVEQTNPGTAFVIQLPKSN